MGPTPRYFMSCIALAQVAPIWARAAAARTGEGPSSQTFWWRRCSEQSRSPRWMAPPRPSPSTWISMWRGLYQHGKADRFRDRHRVIVGADAAVRARDDGNAKLLRGLLGLDLVAHQ